MLKSMAQIIPSKNRLGAYRVSDPSFPVTPAPTCLVYRALMTLSLPVDDYRTVVLDDGSQFLLRTVSEEGSPIKPWDIYACVADGLYQAHVLSKRGEHPSQWQCQQRNVSFLVRSVVAGGLNPEHLAAAMLLLHRSLGNYQVPNVVMWGYSASQTEEARHVLEVGVRYGGTEPAVAVGLVTLPEGMTVAATE